MNITLLRHAETASNLLGQYIGSTDQSIEVAGRARAAALTPRTDIKKVYTSSLKRTQETASLLYPTARIVPCAGLDEMDFGSFEQKSWQDLKDDNAYRAWVDSNCETACPGGESKDSFTRRSVETFLHLLAKESEAGAGELHLVVHGGTIMALLSTLAEPVRPYFEWKADYCGGYLLEPIANYDTADETARILLLKEVIRPKQH